MWFTYFIYANRNKLWGLIYNNLLISKIVGIIMLYYYLILWKKAQIFREGWMLLGLFWLHGWQGLSFQYEVKLIEFPFLIFYISEILETQCA